MFGYSLVLIFLTLTVLALVAGLVLLAIGGKQNKKYSTKLMALRVIMQFLTIISLFLLYLLKK